ncbi:MAG: hypothetical protein GY820_37650, partial [Gammaproteobacteria bacterium]|nr:hypothetical protein [Gammaproteobacteria bacterium]
SFQQKMSVEIAERKLVGREWNIFTPIDAFLHETRELVQCALPGLTRQWPDRIRSCLMQSLPPAWDQILSSSNKNYTEIVEWLRAQSAKIQNTPQEKWDEWVKVRGMGKDLRTDKIKEADFPVRTQKARQI